MHKPEAENYPTYFIIASIAILLPFLLLHFRAWDDNRLTSWLWTFADRNILWFLVLLLSAWAAAFGLSRFRLQRYRHLFLLGCSFLAAALFWGEPEVIVDASRYFTQAKQLAVHGSGYFFSEWGKAVFAWTDMPLMPFFYGLVFKYCGESRICIQILTTLCFSGTVLLTYGLGRLLWDEETGFNGALLLLGFPYLYTQIPLMLVDVPTMFFLLLAVYLFILALRRGGAARSFLAGIAFFCAFYVKFSTWVFLAAFAIVFFLHLPAAPRATIRRGGAVALWSALLIGIVFYLKQDIFLAQIRFLLEYQKGGLTRWGEGYISTFLFQIHGFISAAAVFSVAVAIRKKDHAYGNVACFVLLIFILDLKRIRYTLPLFPFIALLAAYGIREIGDGAIRRFLVYGIVNSSLVVALVAFLPFVKDMSASNIQAAGKFLNDLGVESVEVVPLPIQDGVVNPEIAIPLLDYFTAGRIGYAAVLPRPHLDKYRKSALRFTWAYQPPDFYLTSTAPIAAHKALVVVSSRPVPPLPDAIARKSASFRQSRTFGRSTGVFLDQTVVSIYFD